MRGGGVGFYIKDTLSFNLIDQLSYFENKIFESITLLISHPCKFKFYVTSLYKSNGIIPNVSLSEQNNRFFVHFENLLHTLSLKSHKSFIFTDSNINLLENNPTNISSTYLNCILSHGFIQLSTKATRIQGNSMTLLDHIITNSSNKNFSTVSIISDISDHFPVFILNGKNSQQNEQKHINSRIFSERNLANFKLQMSLQNWDTVITSQNVDDSYDTFWSQYSSIY
jgi:hypothetical protein